MTQTITLKDFTVQEVIDAIEENGFDHLRGEWFQTFDGKLTGGCVLGQGALNLGVIASSDNYPYDIQISDEIANQGLDIFDTIDKYGLVPQLNKFNIPVDSKWNPDSLSPFGAGHTIVRWNDAQDVDVPEHQDEDGEWIETTYTYTLPTYNDVVEMVKDILTPFKNKTVTLAVIDYSVWNPVKVTVNA